MQALYIVFDSTMPLFETKIPIDAQIVSKVVLQKWGIKVQKCLKASQNHTFSGSWQQGGISRKCSIRVTPDPDKKHENRIRDQLIFVNFCVQHKLKHCCGPIPRKQQTEGQSLQTRLYFKHNDLIIAAFQWAQGQPINFFELKWMSDVPLILAWGRYFAQLHKISKLFSKQNPAVASRIQNWNQIHSGVLKKIKLCEEDQKDVGNLQCYGVIHGDLNTSNSFYNREGDYFSVYDTDQTQRGFYEWDIAQAVFGVVMLKQAGMPLSGDPVPQANRQFFQNHIIKGYESVAGEGSINRARLNRMIQIKKEFYRLFCNQAIEEGQIPKDMEAFIHFIAKSFNKPKQKEQVGKPASEQSLKKEEEK